MYRGEIKIPYVIFLPYGIFSFTDVEGLVVAGIKDYGIQAGRVKIP
jgi:hypothetical protein